LWYYKSKQKRKNIKKKKLKKLKLSGTACKKEEEEEEEINRHGSDEVQLRTIKTIAKTIKFFFL